MKRGIVRRTPQAQRDLIDHAYYIAETSIDASDKFLYAAEEAFRDLAAMPEMGSPREFNNSRLKGLRMWSVPSFRKHLIFYLPQNDGIEVIRVLHGSQDLAVLFEEDGESG
jgi:toxin ParE1/3/4